MKPRLVATLAVLPFLAAGCSTLTVSSDYDKAADFTKYHTYSWISSQEVKNDIVRKRIESAVDRELSAKGLKRQDSGADLRVAVHPRLSKEIQVNSYNTGWGYGYGRWGYGGMGMGSTTSTVSEIPVGTLIVDLVDGDKKELVWRGTASSQLDSEASAEKRQEKLDEAMAKLFAQFPPKK